MTADALAAYSLRLLDETRAELQRADAKASFLLGASTVAVGVVAAVVTSSDGWKPKDLSDGYEVAFWVGVCILIAAILLLAAAVYPATKRLQILDLWRRGTEASDRVGMGDFYGDLAPAQSAEAAATLMSASAADRTSRDIHQAWILSRVVRAKYALVRWSFRLVLLSGAVIASALLDGQ